VTESRRWSLIACGCLLLSACGGRRVDEAPTTWPFIESAPKFILAASDLVDVDCDRRYSFAAGDPESGVRILSGERIAGLGGGLVLRGGSSAPRLELSGSWQPGSVDSMRLVLGGLRRGQVKVSWRALDGSEAGEAALPKSAGTGALRDHFLVSLEEASRGPAPFTIEIEPTTVAGEIVTIGEICLGRRRSTTARLGAAAALPWKVTLDDETRDVLLVPAERTLSREGRIAKRSRLELGLGRLAGSSEAVEVLVEVTNAGRKIPAGSAVVSGERLAAGWTDLAFELPPATADSVKIDLSVRPRDGDGSTVLVVSTPWVLDLDSVDQRPNIVLVSLDTLSADHLSLYGYPRATSPNLDRWARSRGMTFDRAVTPASWTLPAHFSLFTGVEAFRHPANYNSIAFDTSAYRFLAEELLASGYRTTAITGGSFVAPDYGLARGFESFRAWRSKEQRDAELEAHLARVSSWLDRRSRQPFFLFFHTYEVHTPNGAREPWFSRFHGGPEERVVDLGPPDPPRPEDGFLGSGHFVLRSRKDGSTVRVDADSASLPTDTYDSAVAYLDERIAPVLERLTSGELGERTIVAVVSDHGESLGEDGRAGHTFLSWDNLHIPMILAGPERLVPRGRVKEQVRLHDLYPTLLELAGVDAGRETDGRSLSGLLRGGTAGNRNAFAYAAPTNRGLAAITPDGLKLEWNNSAWRPLTGGLRWLRVQGAREFEVDETSVGPEAERLRHQLESGYSGQAPGLRVELRVVAGDGLTFELLSDSIDPVSVKSTSISAFGLDWTDVGRLRGALAPGRDLRLNFERIARREVSLAVRVDHPRCARSATATIEGTGETLRSGESVALRPSDCEAGAAPEANLRVTWSGPVPDSAWTPQDEKLKDELKALGYLN
jgi:arylsulfatase A-like enzyme